MNCSPFQCPLCMKSYKSGNEPVTLVCGHSCCYAHLKGMYYCFCCKQRLASKNSLRPNKALLQGSKLYHEMLEQFQLNLESQNTSACEVVLPKDVEEDDVPSDDLSLCSFELVSNASESVCFVNSNELNSEHTMTAIENDVIENADAVDIGSDAAAIYSLRPEHLCTFAASEESEDPEDWDTMSYGSNDFCSDEEGVEIHLSASSARKNKCALMKGEERLHTSGVSLQAHRQEKTFAAAARSAATVTLHASAAAKKSAAALAQHRACSHSRYATAAATASQRGEKRRPKVAAAAAAPNAANYGRSTMRETLHYLLQAPRPCVPQSMKRCGHTCGTSFNEKCCRCSDLRHYAFKYVDGVGMTRAMTCEGYCPVCKYNYVHGEPQYCDATGT